MNTTIIHPAEEYLRNPNNPASLYVRINGKRRRLFINRQEGVIGIHLKKESKLSDAEFWAAIGWLSKEDKLVFTTEKVGKKTVKAYSLKA